MKKLSNHQINELLYPGKLTSLYIFPLFPPSSFLILSAIISPPTRPPTIPEIIFLCSYLSQLYLLKGFQFLGYYSNLLVVLVLFQSLLDLQVFFVVRHQFLLGKA